MRDPYFRGLSQFLALRAAPGAMQMLSPCIMIFILCPVSRLKQRSSEVLRTLRRSLLLYVHVDHRLLPLVCELK